MSLHLRNSTLYTCLRSAERVPLRSRSSSQWRGIIRRNVASHRRIKKQGRRHGSWMSSLKRPMVGRLPLPPRGHDASTQKKDFAGAFPPSRSKLRDCNVVSFRSEIRFRRYNYRELEQGSLPPRSNPSNANGIPMTLDAVTEQFS